MIDKNELDKIHNEKTKDYKALEEEVKTLEHEITKRKKRMGEIKIEQDFLVSLKFRINRMEQEQALKAAMDATPLLIDPDMSETK